MYSWALLFVIATLLLTPALRSIYSHLITWQRCCAVRPAIQTGHNDFESPSSVI